MEPKLVEGRKYQRSEINELETQKTIEKINETETWFFKKKKMDKLVARLTKKKYRGLK